MIDHLEVLEERISEVGYWRWWAEPRPDVFWVEFGGVQLYFSSPSRDLAPSSLVAFCFYKPSIVAFLTETEAKSVAPGWRHALQEDKLEPFSVDSQLFTFTSDRILQRIAKGCSVEYLIGNELAGKSVDGQAMLAFRAQEVGLIVQAAGMAVVANNVELSPKQIAKAADDWFEYWKKYWSRKGSAFAMPYDYACEVTIPFEKFKRSRLNLHDIWHWVLNRKHR